MAGKGDEKEKAAIEQATEFLAKTQEKNGSWLVPTTAFYPSDDNPNREKKTDEVYTYWGTAWATIGLLQLFPVRP